MHTRTIIGRLTRTSGRVLLAVCTLLVIVPLAQAGSDVRTVRASAQGGDRDDAIVQALGDALRQVHGGEIATSRETTMTLRRMARDGERSTSDERRVSSSSSASSAGLISGYRVVSVERGHHGGVLATLDVDVPVYRVAHVQAGRKRIAVYPVETPVSRYTVAGRPLSTEETSERLTQSIVSMLVQSRRFSVLDRDMRQAIEREHGFLGRSDVPLAEKLAIGHTLGAELLLVSRLRELDTGDVSVRDSFTGELRTSGVGSAVLEVRVVMPSTGQLMWSRTVSLAADDFTRPMQVQGVLDELARTSVRGLLESIYPLRVVDGLGGSAVIGQGGDLLQVGQRFEVFKIGRRYGDPYNGESLGARERSVAIVEVDFVGTKTSRARVVSGKVTGDGHVLRRIPSLAAGRPDRNAYRPTSPAPQERPSICLPGDPC